MPIKSNLSDLPTGRSEAGDPPRKPRVVTAVAETWYQNWILTDPNRDHVVPEAGPWRGSYSGKRCDRQLEYALRGIEAEEERSVADVYRMALGTMVHDVFQASMMAAFPGDEAEVPLDLREIGVPGSMRVDLVHSISAPPPDVPVDLSPLGAEFQPVLIPIELKTINGFGFKMAATTFKGPPTGPRSGHRLQLAMAIVALDAPYGILGYLSLENIGPELVASLYDEPTAVQQFAAEWAVSRDEAEALVAGEAKRIERLLAFITAHPDERTPRELVDPDYPAGAIVTRPENGQWVTMVEGKPTQTGKTWMCGYCEMRPQCIADGPGFVTETTVSF